MTIFYEKELEDGTKMIGDYTPDKDEEVNFFTDLIYGNMYDYKQEEIGRDNCEYIIRLMFEDSAFIEQLYNSYSNRIHEYFEDKVEWVEAPIEENAEELKIAID